MANYFEVKASYDKMLNNGIVKRVTEPYLVDALSFTEAESRAIESLTPLISGDFTVKACKRTKIAEIFNIEAGQYWLAKLAFITIDEKSGMEKKSISQMLVGAVSFEDALATLKEGMKGTVSDFEIVSLSETMIMDVFRWQQ